MKHMTDLKVVIGTKCAPATYISMPEDEALKMVAEFSKYKKNQLGSSRIFDAGKYGCFNFDEITFINLSLNI